MALAIEGGGMRGVVSGAMVAALEQLKLLNSFDVIYGSSAGAVAGAYFIAEQARYATTIFYDKLNNRQFINGWRLLVGQPVLWLDFLLDHVCIHERPLAVGRVLHSAIPLNVVCASLSKLTSVCLRDFADPESLFNALRGSARIPVFAGPPVEFRGDKFLDASIYESIPFNSAIQEGAMDIVVLLTRPKGSFRSEPGWLDKYIVAPYLGRIHPDLAKHYLLRAEHYRAEIEAIEHYSSASEGIRILPIQLESTNKLINPLEKSRNTLLDGAMNGFRSVYKALGISVPELVEIITPVPELSASRASDIILNNLPAAQGEEKAR